ncbi:MAG: hypothetical protein Kow00108_12390 [Calditrichia bacterium]
MAFQIKHNIWFILFPIIAMVLACQEKPKQTFSWIKEGDIVFQIRPEKRYRIMSFITPATYNHCGIIVMSDDQPSILSAETTVKQMPLMEWIKLGEDSKFLILRPVEKLQESMKNIIRAAKSYKGRPYDYSYEWDERKIYNTELIQKAFYKGAGVHLGSVEIVEMIYIAPEDSTIFLELKHTLPNGKEVVPIETILNSALLKNILKN